LLDGIIIRGIKQNIDERGIFAEIFRKDWQDTYVNDEVLQTNLSISYPGIIRAWHRHQRGQVDYFLLLKGTIKLCAYDETAKEINEIVCSEKNLQVVRIPGYYWHGFKNIGSKDAMLIYFVNKLYDSINPDEERRAWNDAKIIDSRTGAPYDWNKPPHK